MVGIENWADFDKSGKISTLYIMSMIPFGVIQADKKYNEWSLTNGQASVISGSIPWGFANALGALTLAYGESWPDNAVMNRLNVLALYGASYGAPFLAKKYIQNKSYSEDDANFIRFSMGLGVFNAVSTIALFEKDNIRAGVALMLGITNGFGYLANSLIEDRDLKKGDSRIIALGTGAAFILRTGFGILFSENSSKLGILLTMASVNAGWFYTLNKIMDENYENSYLSKDKKGNTVFSFASCKFRNIVVMMNYLNKQKEPIPGIRFQATFF